MAQAGHVSATAIFFQRQTFFCFAVAQFILTLLRIGGNLKIDGCWKAASASPETVSANG